MKIVLYLVMATLFLASLSSCQKYGKYDNNEVVENSYSGQVERTSVGNTPAGDFTGDGDSGTYSFAWENDREVASVTFDVTTSGGSAQIIVRDARGDEVFNQSLPNGGEDSFSGPTSVGKEGTWLVTINLTDFNGDGSYSIHPGE